MAVSDLLLKSPTVDARPKAATKAPDTPRDGRDNGNASFSDVYAKERQAKPVDRPARNDGARDKSVEEEGGKRPPAQPVTKSRRLPRAAIPCLPKQ